MVSAFDPTTTFVHLAPDGAAETIEVTPSFWTDLMSGSSRYTGRLVTASDMTRDWPHWERHPAGEELLVVLAGAATVILEEPGGEESRTPLTAGDLMLVPRGLWHRLEVSEPGRILFVTQGEGTDHRPVGG